MSWISEIFSGSTKGIVDGVGNVLDNVVTTAEERINAKAGLAKVVADEMQKAQELAAAEMQSARNREVLLNQSEQASWLAKNTVSLIALGYTLFNFAIYLLALAGKLKSTENMQILIINSITNIALLIVGYYFGSSTGSAKNREALNQVIAMKK